MNIVANGRSQGVVEGDVVGEREGKVGAEEVGGRVGLQPSGLKL